MIDLVNIIKIEDQPTGVQNRHNVIAHENHQFIEKIKFESK